MFDYTSTYLRMNQKPWFPIMGEFHYSRYQDEFWEEELRKIQAGGVTIVSTYVIWIHHEEEEGVFFWMLRFAEILAAVQKGWTNGVFKTRSMGAWRSTKWRIPGLADGKREKDSPAE